MNEKEFEQPITPKEAITLLRDGELAIRARLEEAIAENPDVPNVEESRDILEAFSLATDIVEADLLGDSVAK